MVEAYFKKPNYVSGSKDVKGAELKNKICVLPINPGQTYHIGKEGTAILLLMASKFKHIVFCVADLLYIHNEKSKNPNLDNETLKANALASGNEFINWLEQQKELIPELKNIKIEVFRWEHWLNQKSISSYKKKTDLAYQQNEHGLKSIVRKTANDFNKNFIDESFYTEDNTAIYTKNNIQYLLEEFYVTWSWIEELDAMYPNSQFIQAYPREPNPVLQLLDTKFIDKDRFKYEFFSIKFNVSHTYHLQQPANIKEIEESPLPQSPIPTPSSSKVASGSSEKQKEKPDLPTSIPNNVDERIYYLEMKISELNDHVLFLYKNLVTTAMGDPYNFPLKIQLPADTQKDQLTFPNKGQGFFPAPNAD